MTMPPPSRDEWYRDIPDAVLQQDQQQTDAQQWGDQARADVAQQWGDSVRATLPTPSDTLTNPLGTRDMTAAVPQPELTPPAEQRPAPAAVSGSLPPVTAPLVAPASMQAPQPDASGMLDKNGVIAYVQQHAQSLGLDPAAVLAVANQEGLGTAPGSHWTLPGEGNISFGPPSWFGNGAGSSILSQHGADAARWSWSPEGIDYWLSQVAPAAKGLTGTDAIAAIVHGFEKPREDLAAGEIKKAQDQYANFQGGPVAPSIGGPDLSSQSTVQPTQAPAAQPSNGFMQAVQDARDAVGNAAGGAITATRQTFDQAVQGARDALGSVGSPLDIPALQPINQRVLQRTGEGGLNAGDVLQGETDASRAAASAILTANPQLARASQQTGTTPFIDQAFNKPSVGPVVMPDEQTLQQTAARFGVNVDDLKQQVQSFNQGNPTIANQLATMGVQAYLGAAGGALAKSGNPLGFAVDPQGQLTPFGLLNKVPGVSEADQSGYAGPLGESRQLVTPETGGGVIQPGRPALPAPTPYGPAKPATPMPGNVPPENAMDQLHVETGPRVSPGVPQGPQPVYDANGVMLGFVPREAITYDQYGVRAGFQPDATPGLLPNANRARAIAADRNFATAPAAPTPPVAPSNPFDLSPKPVPGAQPLAPPEVMGHLEYLDQLHTQLDNRINELQNQLEGGVFNAASGDRGGGGIVRPPQMVGWTDQAILDYAKQEGLNPYQVGWFGGGKGELSGQTRIVGAAKQTATSARAEIAQLETQRQQIAQAAENIWQNGALEQPLYRPPTQSSALPFDYNGGANGTAESAALGALPNARGGGPNPAAGAAGASAENGARAANGATAEVGPGSAARQARLAANDVYQGGEAPVTAGQAFTRDPQGNIIPIKEQSTADLLQSMIDEAKSRGNVPPQLINEMQAQMGNLYGPTELAAGLNPGAVLRAVRPTGTAIRTGLNPASAAPQAVQDALNGYDGMVRLAQAGVQRQVLSGALTSDQAAQVVGQMQGVATRQFLTDVGNSADGVIDKTLAGSSTRPPVGWVSGGSVSSALADKWVSPEVATVVRNTLNTRVTVPGLEGLAKINGAIKQIGLTGSPYHFIQEQLQAVRLGASTGNVPGTGVMFGRGLINGINPGAFRSWMTSPAIATVVDRAAQAGATLGRSAGEGIDLSKGIGPMLAHGALGGAVGGVGTYAVQKGRGATDEEAMKAALIGAGIGAVSAGPVASVVGPAIFERQIPTLKIIGFKMLTDGGMSDTDAAQMVNNTFGGQNLVRMARDPNLQALMRSVVLAPDWWESWARNIGSAIPGMPVSLEAGNAARKYVATTVISAGVALEGLNHLMTGHFTNDNAPGHTLDLEIPQSKVPGAPQGGDLIHFDVLGPLKPMAQLVTSGGDVGAFGRSRLSPLAGLTVAGLQNKNGATGGEIVAPGTPPLPAAAQLGAYEAQQAIPVAAQAPMEGAKVAGPVGAVASGLGLRTSASNAVSLSRGALTEIDRLNKAGYNGVSMPYPQKSFVTGSSKIDLSADERRQLASLRGQLVAKDLEPILANPNYVRMNDDQKALQIGNIVSRADAQAKQAFLNQLSAADRDRRLRQGQQIRGKPVNPPAPGPSLPQLSLPGR